MRQNVNRPGIPRGSKIWEKGAMKKKYSTEMKERGVRLVLEQSAWGCPIRFSLGLLDDVSHRGKILNKFRSRNEENAAGIYDKMQEADERDWSCFPVNES